MQPTIQTQSGQHFDFLAPHTHRFDIEEIAHALSNLCRFTGHTSDFYSVAQHSVLVSHLVQPINRKNGLMHDAHEAYVNDISAPLKLLLPDYCELELRVERTVRRAFGLPEVMPREVKNADLVALQTERLSFMPADPAANWADLAHITGLPYPIKPLTPDRAYAAFMDRWNTLVREA